MPLENFYEPLTTKGWHDPHHLLGLHKGGKVIRLWRPKAKEVSILLKNETVSLTCIDPKGLFELSLNEPISSLNYRVFHPDGSIGHDPYAFLPTFTKEDETMFKEGRHLALYEALGSHVVTHQGVSGVKFALWAPCARGVALLGDLNHWDPMQTPMRQMGSSGVWELFIPGLNYGMEYQFGIYTAKGDYIEKADPCAFQGAMRPKTISLVCNLHHFTWTDKEWMEKRKHTDPLSQPLNIYEVHLGSWKRENNSFLNYRELGKELTSYCQKMGYTHVELMPIMGHPLDESWGYQISGFYAISRRYGTIEDFQYLVNYLHLHGIGIILDWVPGHFPKDPHALAHFDGTCLYEHEDFRQGYHPQWTTHIFNFGRYEVANFLLGSALFYLREMHVDGLRVDAVSSMVYLDFERKEGEWIPNVYGGNENLEAISFLRSLTTHIKQEFPKALLIAEESHAFPGVTQSVEKGGLGFDLKWSLGWMNDTLRYFKRPFAERTHYLHELKHEFTYFFDDRFLLPLSHDEVVHGKKSLLSKMPGNEWEKFANLRLLLSYMICHPGKNLLFMGGEFGQWLEWECLEEVHWDLLQVPYHRKLADCTASLNHLYQKQSALSEKDFEKEAWEWVLSKTKEPVLSYLRKGGEETLLCIHHFGPTLCKDVLFSLEMAKQAEVIFTTDASEYGGRGIPNILPHFRKGEMTLTLPPLSTLILTLE